MTITMHLYSARDQPHLIDFRRAITTRENKNDYPTDIDLYEILNAPDRTNTIGLWEDEHGDIVAFAMTAPAYGNYYFHLRPHIQEQEIKTLILAWAVQQFTQTGAATVLDTPCRDTDHERAAFLKQQGFTLSPGETLHMARLLSEAFPPARFPDGFRLRHVMGIQELDTVVALHQEAFGTKNMTPGLRRSIMENPAYIAELDLLLEAPDGNLASFCYCAIPTTASQYNEPGEGEIAIIGTRPVYQKSGIGQAMLLAALQCLKDFGVEVATLGTDSENTRAQSVFAAVGFRTMYRTLWYQKEIV